MAITKNAMLSVRTYPHIVTQVRVNAQADDISQSDYLQKLVEKDTLRRGRKK